MLMWVNRKRRIALKAWLSTSGGPLFGKAVWRGHLRFNEAPTWSVTFWFACFVFCVTRNAA